MSRGRGDRRSHARDQLQGEWRVHGRRLPGLQVREALDVVIEALTDLLNSRFHHTNCPYQVSNSVDSATQRSSSQASKIAPYPLSLNLGSTHRNIVCWIEADPFAKILISILRNSSADQGKRSRGNSVSSQRRYL